MWYFLASTQSLSQSPAEALMCKRCRIRRSCRFGGIKELHSLQLPPTSEEALCRVVDSSLGSDLVIAFVRRISVVNGVVLTSSSWSRFAVLTPRDRKLKRNEKSKGLSQPQGKTVINFYLFFRNLSEVGVSNPRVMLLLPFPMKTLSGIISQERQNAYVCLRNLWSESSPYLFDK